MFYVSRANLICRRDLDLVYNILQIISYIAVAEDRQASERERFISSRFSLAFIAAKSTVTCVVVFFYFFFSSAEFPLEGTTRACFSNTVSYQ